MQIAGSRCVVCGKNVGVIRDGIACTKCRVVYHRACLRGSDCSNCGQPVLGGQEAHALPSPAERIKLERPTSVTVIGRLTYVGVPLSVLMVLVGLFETPGDLVAGSVTIVSGFLGGVFSVVLGSGLLRGKEWARQFTLWVTPLVFAVEIVVGDNGFLEPGFRWWRSAIGLGAYGAFAFALTRPKTSAFFKRGSQANVTA